MLELFDFASKVANPPVGRYQDFCLIYTLPKIPCLKKGIFLIVAGAPAEKVRIFGFFFLRMESFGDAPILFFTSHPGRESQVPRSSR